MGIFEVNCLLINNIDSYSNIINSIIYDIIGDNMEMQDRIFTVKMDESLYMRMRNAAFKNMVPMGEFVRKAVVEKLEKGTENALK